MKIIKFLLNDFKFANRDKREISAYSEMGFDVDVLYPYRDGNEPEPDDRYTFHRLKKTWPEEKKNIISWKLFVLKNHLDAIIQLRKMESDIISCHDLYALRLGWIAGLLKRNRPKLIYDSHEFEIGRNLGKKRSKLQKYLVAKEERFLMKRCAFSIMVNDSIADEVQRIHGLKQRPVVVRNVPPIWKHNEKISSCIRDDFCSKFNTSKNSLIIMYHGNVTVGRGIELILEALSKVKGVYFVIMGNGDSRFKDSLLRKSKDLGIQNHVLMMNAVPIEELKDYVGAVDVGIIVALPISKSYYLSLPNKFFENIQSETPVVVSNVPEMSRLTKKYGVGLVAESDAEELAAAINRLNEDKELLERLKENTKKAKTILNWEREKRVLIEAVNKYIV